MPGAVGSMEGAEGGACAMGNVEASGSLGWGGLNAGCDEDGPAEVGAPLTLTAGVGGGSWGVDPRPGSASGGAPRSRGVYSVVRFVATE